MGGAIVALDSFNGSVDVARAPSNWPPAGFATAFAPTDLEPDVRRCLRDAEPLLESLGERAFARG